MGESKGMLTSPVAQGPAIKSMDRCPARSRACANHYRNRGSSMSRNPSPTRFQPNENNTTAPLIGR